MLEYQNVVLEEVELVHLDYSYFLYNILVDHKEVGRLTYRLGKDEDFILDGHIGYEIDEPYRGHHYAYHACMALKNKIKEYSDHVLITCDIDNYASKKTIEKLGAIYLETKAIPKKLKDYYPGSTGKLVYQWNIGGE